MQAHSLSKRAASRTPISPHPNPLTEDHPSAIAAGPGLAHDARNLLGALQLYTDLLAEPGVLRPEHAHYAREIRLLTDRTLTWIGRLLESMDKGPEAPEAPFEMKDGATVLRTLEPLLQRLARPWARVTVRVAAGLPPLPFSVELLERVTLNLVRNAADAVAAAPRREQPGEIVVTLGFAAGQLELTVEDDGPGLPPVAAARLVLGGARRRSRHGRGLGHAIVRELAEASGAATQVRVAPGRSTAITLSWSVPAAGARTAQGASAAC